MFIPGSTTDWFEHSEFSAWNLERTINGMVVKSPLHIPKTPLGKGDHEKVLSTSFSEASGILQHKAEVGDIRCIKKQLK